VISVKVLNERRRTVIVVPLSSSPKASPPILIPISCDGRPTVAVSDQIRAVAKERLHSRLGVVTTDEMAALEGGLRQIMQL
jgi:mRNA interferase MazF